MNQEDDDLRKLFHELRLKVESQVPPFKKVSRNTEHTKRSPLFRWAVALTCTVGLGFFVYYAGRQTFHTPEPHRTALSISEWKAPTDFLLNTPAIEILKSTPDFGSSVSDLQLTEKIGVQQ